MAPGGGGRVPVSPFSKRGNAIAFSLRTESVRYKLHWCRQNDANCRDEGCRTSAPDLRGRRHVLRVPQGARGWGVEFGHGCFIWRADSSGNRTVFKFLVLVSLWCSMVWKRNISVQINYWEKSRFCGRAGGGGSYHWGLFPGRVYCWIRR